MKLMRMLPFVLPVLAGLLTAGPPARAEDDAGVPPTEAERFDQLGNEYMESGSYLEAAAAYRQAVEADSTFLPGWRHLALAYTEMGREDAHYFARADTIYQYLAAALPTNDVEMLRGRAHLEALAGNYDGSVEDYQLILAERPDDCDALVQITEVRNTQSEVIIEAIHSITPEIQQYAADIVDAQLRLLDLCPEQVTDYANLFNSFTRSRRYQEGAAVFETILAVHPGDAELTRRTGDLYFMNRSWGEAARLFGELLELEPENQEYRLKYISSLRKIEEFETADQELQRYIEIRDAQAAQDSSGN